MVTLETVAAFGLSLAAGVLYIHVGRLFVQRPARDVHRPGLISFAMWWFNVAGFTLLGATSTLLYFIGVQQAFVHIALTWAGLLPLTVALASLLAYLLYLATGKRSLIGWVAVAYAGVYVLLMLLVAYLDPIGASLDHAQVRVDYANELPRPAAYVFVLALLAPAFVGAVVYAKTFFQVKDPTSRYRVALVSASLVIWFGVSIVASFAGWGSARWWPLTSRFIGLVAALGVLVAYRPPAVVRRKLGVVGLDMGWRNGAAGATRATHR